MTAALHPYRVIFEAGHGFADRIAICDCGAHKLTDLAGAAVFAVAHNGCVGYTPMSPEVVEHHRRTVLACPHGPNEPCTCAGCHACAGYTVGCTCDIDWAELHELALDAR